MSSYTAFSVVSPQYNSGKTTLINISQAIFIMPYNDIAKVFVIYLLHENIAIPYNTSSQKLTVTSASCDFAISTKVLAAGCTISNNFIIVAPSFEIVALSKSKTKYNYQLTITMLAVTNLSSRLIIFKYRSLGLQKMLNKEQNFYV